uniref:Fibrillin n=2 Tax=Ixodes ricinus TaxID=34613 RepID=A0A147BER9_IXORI
MRSVALAVALLLSLTTSPARCLVLDADLQLFVSTIERYSTTKNDIVFVLDESGSIGADVFPAELAFTEMVARLLVVSPEYSRLTVMTYSNDNLVHIDQVGSSGDTNMCKFVYEVNKIPYRSGGTRTREALEHAGFILRSARPGANRIVVLISDGQANSGSEPSDIARLLRGKGIVIFGVGVAAINKAELLDVASSPSHTYMLRNFEYIKKVNKDLRKDIVEKQWDEATSSSLCEKQCDANAICACGARGGTYQCVCNPGYQEAGTPGQCRPCPRGTYRGAAGNEACLPCPENSTTKDEGARNVGQCSCLAGYEGSPANNQPCTPILCAQLSSPIGGSTLPRKCGNTFNTSCNFKCDEGHCPYACDRSKLASGDVPWNKISANPRVCQADKKWSGLEFSCAKVRCPPVNLPPHGRVNCTNSQLDFGTECQVACDPGYNINGSTSLVCQMNGQWDKEPPTCDVVTCPPLKSRKKLQLRPSSCKNSSPFESICQYSCIKGFLLVDANTKVDVDGTRVCLANGTWSNMNQSITCKDIEKPVLKDCPADRTVETDPNAPYCSNVTWLEPSAEDNDAGVTVRVVHPPGVTKPPHGFAVGETLVTYIAEDRAGLASEPCSFTVFVSDNQPPVVVFCPDDIIEFSERSQKNITWEKPIFKDNAGPPNITTTRDPGSVFTWGPASDVTYHATDLDGNVATCSFKVVVKPYPCPYYPPPKNGFVTCDSETDRQFCSVYCDQGYEFAFPPAPLYRCKQMKNKGEWSAFSRNRKLKLPWPDCAVPKKPKKTDYTVDFKFATNSCQVTEEQKQRLKKKFFEAFKKKVGHVVGMCDPNQGCTVDNVHIDCQSKNKTKIQKRDLSVKKHGRRGSSAPSKPLHKRDTVDDVDDDFESTFKLSFTLPLREDLNVTKLVEACEDCKNTSLVHPSEVVATALRQALESATSEAANSSVVEALPDAVLVESTQALKSECGHGQVSNNLVCVNCPVGTYYHNETTCLPCPIGTYSDLEGASSCLSCPDNKTTLSEKSSSLSECRALCKPGTFSTSGKEPCMSCDMESYQDISGQASCKKCPAGLSTGFWGAKESSSCQDTCAPGTYSISGIKPCAPCPVGFYQPLRNQTSCMKCENGLSTHTVGSTAKSDCVDVQTCELLKPCAEGSTCVDMGSTYTCACPEGLVGPNCENNIDDCAEDLCLNGGVCIDGLNNYTCSCPPGFTGFNCEVNINDCDSNPCQNGATCIDGVNTFACKCAKGFRGKTCHARYHDCATRPCQNGGSCFDSIDGYRCCCRRGFTGKSCELIETPCSPNPCEHQGTCVAKGDEYECTCLEGFTGPRCEENVDDCQSSPCLNGGTCVDGVASFSCSCSGLYTGALCETVRPSNFSLHFLDASVSNYARISVKRNLRAITLSFFMKTSQSKERGTPVSYAFADPETGAIVDNGLVISDPNKLLLYIFQESYDTNTVANDNNWHHCAVTWNSKTGQWTFYWDGQSRITGVRSMGGHMFKGELVVGQEQDQVGGAFSGIESYSGHVAELNMWDYEMSASEITSLRTSCGNAGNVVAWPELRNGIEGNILSSGYPDICAGAPATVDECKTCHCSLNSLENRLWCARNAGSCDINPCQNGQACVIGDDGSSQCDCEEGFQGKFCEYDVDECLEGKHNCSHKCVNSLGSYACSCPAGLHLSDDGVTCIDSSYCTDGRSAYLHGEHWQRDCEICTCEMGFIKCSALTCESKTCPEGQVVFHNLKDCCPSCVEAPPSCQLLPNKTLATFDGLSLPVYDRRRYSLFQDCYHGDYFGYLDETGYQRAVRVYIHCLTATMYHNGTVLVNDKTVSLPHQESTILKVSSSADGAGVQLQTHHGVVVSVKSDGTIVTTIAKKFAGKVCGLCGNMNNDGPDDFKTRHHIPAKSVEEYVSSWEVPTERKTRGKQPESCRKRSHRDVKRAMGMCNALKGRLFHVCYKHVKNLQAFVDACMDHMCSCHRNSFCYCDSFASFKLACERHNVTFNKMPGGECERQCPEGMTFDACGPARVERCHPYSFEAMDTCMPGCYCPPEKLWENGKCVEKKKYCAVYEKNLRAMGSSKKKV